jgi:putative ABC transport system substrate-binding protein
MRIVALGLLALALGGMGAAAAGPRTVAITAIVAHPALDAVRQGILRGLADAGYADGRDLIFTYEDARGNPAMAAQIARRIAAAAPAVIVAISTPSAQAVAAATKDIPVVFAAVTDPLAAGLVASLQAPGGNVTGVSDMARIGDHVGLIREITPSVMRLGVLYNPGEANSLSSVAALKAAAAAAGIAVVEGPAERPADVEDAARGLVGKVDAIYVPTDNTVVSKLEAAVAVANEARLPLYAADTSSVARGALAAIGFNYFAVGRQTAVLIDRVLKGEKPGTIPVAFASGTDLYVNGRTARAIGLALPPSVLARAAKVVE